MAERPSNSDEPRRLVRPPSSAVAYVALLAAVVSGSVHLLLAPSVGSVDPTLELLFYVTGVGWLAWSVVTFSRFWWRDLYLVAMVYALLTLIAFLTMGGRLDDLAIVAKAAEVTVALVSLYLYVTSEPD